MKTIYICSPGKAETIAMAKQHIIWARAMVLKALEMGYAPISTILMYPRGPMGLVNETPEKRENIMRASLGLVGICDEMWLCYGEFYGEVGYNDFRGDGAHCISDGMLKEWQCQFDRKRRIWEIPLWQVNTWAEEFGLGEEL